MLYGQDCTNLWRFEIVGACTLDAQPRLAPARQTAAPFVGSACQVGKIEIFFGYAIRREVRGRMVPAWRLLLHGGSLLRLLLGKSRAHKRSSQNSA